MVLTGRLISARVWRRLWRVGVIAGLALGDAAILTDRLGLRDTPFDPLAMVLLFAVLVSIIGGRAVPAFMRSWLQTTPPCRTLYDTRLLSSSALIATALGGGTALAGQTSTAGTWLVSAGVLHCLRLIGWQSLRTRHYPA